MTSDKQQTSISEAFVRRSKFYCELMAEREEIERFKWLESEKAGTDIGYERALLEWIRKHRDAWRQAWRREMGGDGG